MNVKIKKIEIFRKFDLIFLIFYVSDFSILMKTNFEY